MTAKESDRTDQGAARTDPAGPRASEAGGKRPGKGMLILGVLLFLSVLIPYLFWQGTWFGRNLTDEQMRDYLQADERPRRIQHALSQIADRIIEGDASVTRWYPQVILLSTHDNVKVRTLAAWVMGQDNRSESFHRILGEMLADEDPLVVRNAALALVRFNDRRGKPVILSMLQPYTYRSPRDGVISLRLEVDDPVETDTKVAALDVGDEGAFELRSPLPGLLRAWLVEDGARVFEGQPILRLSPADNQAREALRALYLIGEREDLSLINRIAAGAYDLSAQTRRQAILTAEEIGNRLLERPGQNPDGD